MPNRAERKAASRLGRRVEDKAQARGMSVDQRDPTPHHKRRGKTVASHRYGLEFRIRPERQRFGWNFDWERSWKWYATAARRDAAMVVLNRDHFFEYRPIER